MIDPKLNEIPAEEEEKLNRREGKSRPGLGINDTTARDANLSVGSRGVNVSGVSAGAGAGAGSTSVMPSTGRSPAPTVVPRPHGTGMTPLGETQSAKSLGSELHLDEESVADHEIARRAYRCWHERGCPHGSPEVDWHRAERELREERRRKSAAASA
jgi:hypothetical protein